MRKLNLIKSVAIVTIVTVFSSCNQEGKTSTEFSEKSPYELVNPFIGTGGHGHTYPGATAPFGMVQLSPDTRLEGWDGCSGYHNTDSIIYGFSHTHLSGTGVSDYGDVLLMPTQGQVQFDNGSKTGAENGYASWFDKKTEKASPGYYEVNLAEHDIDVRLTTTQRVGIHEYSFNEKGASNVVLDVTHRDELLDYSIEMISSTEIVGHRVSKSWAEEQHIYFVVQFSRDFAEHIYDLGNKKLAVSFDVEKGETIMLKVGISSVSIVGARANLEAEAPHWDFEKYKAVAKTEWEKALGKISVKGTDVDKLAVFYSALYHTMIAPNVFSDVTGEYRGMDQQIHKTDNTEAYTIFSLWDTFRGAHPLYTIIEQEKTNAFINTFLAHYAQGGRLPVWELAGNETDCMIGYHSVSVITDAYVKGIRGFDAAKAFAAMQHSATLDHLGLESYKRKGFIAAGDEAESVSKTLEYAYDDWCIATFAKEIKNDSVSNEYIQRGQYYKNMFNPQVGFMQSKMNGGWSYGFNPSEVNFNFTEANSWQYSMFAPQDISGLIDLYGGKEKFDSKLDELFATEMELSGRHQVDITGLIGQYAHGNEPSHHMAYLYNYIGKPWKTQEKINQILNEQYSNTPEGLSGNEDCGQMSAWYVLSSMGFYSVTPGLDYYTIGTPHFNEAAISLENGNTFTISANNLSDQNIYIQSATLNGATYKRSFLKHAAIMFGGELVFEMGNQPNKEWGTVEGNTPIAQINQKDEITAVPYFSSPSQTFSDSLEIKLVNIDKGCDIYYSIAKEEFIKYESSFSIFESVKVETYAMKNGVKSHSVQASYKKIKGGRSIQLETQYSNQYSAGGDDALINYLKGSANFRTGFWQGYEGKDVVAVVDLGKVESVNSISVGALQDIKSWIFYPKYVNISVSDNATNFKLLAEIKNEFPDNKHGAFMQEFTKKMNAPINVRYIKVEVENYGVVPEWHMGAGGTSWLFLDEITIE